MSNADFTTSSSLRDDVHTAILDSIFAGIADGLLVWDDQLRVVNVNDYLLRHLGRGREEVIGQDWETLFPHLIGTTRRGDLLAVLAGGPPHRGRLPLVNAADGSAHLFDVSASAVCDAQTGLPKHVLEIAREITEEVRMQLDVMDAHSDLLRVKEQLEEKTAQVDAANELLQEKCLSLEIANRRLERLAVIDIMTDLPNHRAFQEQLTYQVRQSQRHQRPFALILLDVDNFKFYNDRYGHPEGDDLLAGVAGLMRDCVRGVDLPARYGGEEFAIILPETDRYGAAVVAERLRRLVAGHPFRNASVTVSVGVAEFPSDADDGSGLVACADKAMYHAKSSGKNAVSLWRGPQGGEPVPAHVSQEAMHMAVRRCQSVPSLPGHLRSGSASGSRLLLVDQDALALGTLREALQDFGYAVTGAGSAQEALEVLVGSSGGFDLLLTDLALPDKDGFALRAEARVLSPGLPIIFTSAYASASLTRRVQEDTHCEFLCKPFLSETLMNLIETVLAHRAPSLALLPN